MAINIQSFEIPKTISHGQRWGRFIYNAHNLTLRYGPDYEIDLESMNTSAAMLDWGYQLEGAGIEPWFVTLIVHLL